MKLPLALFVALISAHSGIVCADDERVTISYWEKWTGEEGEAMEHIVDRFNESQERIFIEYQTVSQIDQKLLLSVLAKNPPDLAGLWAPFVAPYADRGLINPLSSLAEEAGFDAATELDPTYYEMCRHRGELWALPSSAMAIMLYKNDQILGEAGIDPEIEPADFAKLDELGKQLTRVEVERNGTRREIPFLELTESELTNRSYEITRLGFDPTVAQVWLPYFPGWFGGGLIDPENGNVDYDAPSLQAALAWYRTFFETYGLEQVRRFGSSHGGFASSGNPFFSGKVAMIINGPWLPKFAEEYAPGLRFRTCALPSVDGIAPDTTLADSDIIVIPRGAKHPKEAFEFLAFLSRLEISEQLNLAQSKMSPLAKRSTSFVEEHPNREIERFHNVMTEGEPFLVYRSVVFSRFISELYTAFDIASRSLEESHAFLRDVEAKTNERIRRAEERWDRRETEFREVGNVR